MRQVVSSSIGRMLIPHANVAKVTCTHTPVTLHAPAGYVRCCCGLPLHVPSLPTHGFFLPIQQFQRWTAFSSVWSHHFIPITLICSYQWEFVGQSKFLPPFTVLDTKSLPNLGLLNERLSIASTPLLILKLPYL